MAVAVFRSVLTICFVLADVGFSARINLSEYQRYIGSGPAANEKMGFSKSPPCATLERGTLSRILGAAFNPRYMRVDPPLEQEEDDEDPSDLKRKISGYRPFAVDEDFAHELSETPAWEVDHFQDEFTIGERKRRSPEDRSSRGQRSVGQSTPWECKATVKWIDLGNNYFPRYMRSVECGDHECWYGKYSCKPKSFTVKILRRKDGRCAYEKRRETIFDLPTELRELWVWEERAVNFCCECAP